MRPRRNRDKSTIQSAAVGTLESGGAALDDAQQPLVQKRLDDYVTPELQNLKQRAARFERRANLWYLFVAVILFIGVGFAVYRSIVTTIPKPDLHWPEVVRSIASSLIVVGLLSAMARFAYVMGKSFMVESIRNNNRRHAISFGEFYLQAFWDKVTWPEAKEAFRSWNIDIGSSFLMQSPDDIDPQLVQNVAMILGAMGKNVREKQ